MSRLAILLPALYLLFAPLPASAQTPVQTLKTLHLRMNKLLAQKHKDGSAAAKKNKEEVKKVVNTLLDFPELARLSLAKHWEGRNEKERAEFTGILKDLIERNYIKQLRSNLDYKLEYKGEKVTGESALVQTVVKVEKKGRVTEIQIDYKMRKVKGAWMVFDVSTDEVSIVQNYRSQFNRIIRKESYEALVKKMKRKLEETPS
jgi:phospholipid transport system substrate-binding protein